MKAKKYFLTGDGLILNAEQAATAGLVQDVDCSEGFLTRASDKEYADLIVAVKVHVAACDGNFTKKFKTVDAAKAFVKQEWPTGNVADDGVNRFDGYTVACSTTPKLWLATNL